MKAKVKIRLNRADAGVTLLELMLASGVLSLAFIFLFGSVFSVAEQASGTSNRTAARSQLASIQEEIQNSTLDELLAYQPPPIVGLGSGAHVQVACVNTDGNEVTLPLAEGAAAPVLPNVFEVRITVVHRDDRGRLLSVTGATLHEG